MNIYHANNLYCQINQICLYRKLDGEEITCGRVDASSNVKVAQCIGVSGGGSVGVMLILLMREKPCVSHTSDWSPTQFCQVQLGTI